MEAPRLVASHESTPVAGTHRRASFRADIQGLRAVAVLIVALGHARVPGLSGGFVGVDVFFVISGFLITQWLFGRTLDSGRVPFADFYAARARRILPAATLTLAVTCTASVVYLNPVRALSAVHDSIWAAVFAANIHFANVGADYFARDDPPSPIQHFWTLGVEEQFYLVWPVLLAATLVVLRIAGRSSGTARRAVGAVLVVGSAVSMTWCIRLTASNPTAAYFSTPARAWELGVGALIAVALPSVVRVPARLRSALTWVGLAAIVAAAVAYGPRTPFPGVAALLPVVGASLVVAGGTAAGAGTGAALLLSRRPLPLVGDLSYAFYLWHWPALVIAAEYFGHPLSPAENVILLGAAFAVSYVTYWLYENPLRHARRLVRPRAALTLWPVTVAAVVVAAGIAMAVVETPRAAAPSLELASERVDRASAPSTGAARVRAALLASVAPARLRQPVPRALAPPVGRLRFDVYRLGNCMAGTATQSKVCTLGDTTSSRRLVVLGDSHAEMWLPPLLWFAARYHWSLVPLIKDGCVPSIMGSHDCAAWYAWARDQVRLLHPRAVVVSQSWSSWGLDGAAAVAREVHELAPLTERLVVMEDPPARNEAAVDCLLRRAATLGSCAFPVSPGEASAYASVRRDARGAGTAYVRTRQWFCARGLCPTIVGTIVTYRDTTHITATYARVLSEPLAAEIATATRR
jgi:peptidoglycan/LPS O-acetylase OafA/YrhL